MSSKDKTPNLELNQWEASDAPQREDFNEDNRLLDAAVEDCRQRTKSMAAGLEAANHDLYRLYLQQYYDAKDVPHRATLFFDAFRDESMMDSASNAYLDKLNHCLCNWDKGFYATVNTYFSSTCQLGGGYTGIAQSYPSAGPIRLLKLSFTYKPLNFTSSYNIDLSFYATDALGSPVNQRQLLKTFTQGPAAGGNDVVFEYSPSSPDLINETNFALSLENSTLSGAQVLQPGLDWPMGLQGQVYGLNAGGSWARQDVVNGCRIAFAVVASRINNPPHWGTKEVALSRPCTEAVVYITQDAASVGRILPKAALYDAGETPVFMSMTRDPSRDLPLSGGKCETCYTYAQTAPKERVKLSLQMDGMNSNDRIYEYGCILSE